MERLPDVPLRAAVSNRCNFACCYCPKGDWAGGGMENYTPDRYAGVPLTTEQYAAALARIRHIFGIRTVSFVGLPAVAPSFGAACGKAPRWNHRQQQGR